MKFRIDNDYKVNIFGKQLNSLQHMGILFGYVFFLMIPWPLISNSYLFIPLAIAILPIILPEFIYSEIYSGIKMYRILMYGGYVIATFIYTHFFLDSSFFVSIIHFIVYATFGYIYSKKISK
ncbi:MULTISPECIES: hypothetical protein [Winogradskyella]|uniref:hypothetical protein n=1 Tax=Winogradskyella TaxID=286104 RepID=UPI0015C96C5D|nr:MULTISPECIES: hypothetical protein [Winogradskyella]QXP78786.1 hypothetical protein H0I32_16515 [Winogradskyella sp. HaHa_3_26]